MKGKRRYLLAIRVFYDLSFSALLSSGLAFSEPLRGGRGQPGGKKARKGLAVLDVERKGNRLYRRRQIVSRRSAISVLSVFLVVEFVRVTAKLF